MMDPTDRQAASRGFTVVELLVALGLAAVVFGLIVSFFANMSRSTTTQNAAAAAQQTARAGLDFMAQELRLAGLDPLNSAGAGIEQISATGIRFTSDSCNVQIGDSGTCDNPVPDGNVNGKNERVSYWYDAGSRVLRRYLYEGTTSRSLDTAFGAGRAEPRQRPAFHVSGRKRLTDNSPRRYPDRHHHPNGPGTGRPFEDGNENVLVTGAAAQHRPLAGA